MIKDILLLQKQKKRLIQGFLTLTIFLTIYTVLDRSNGGYIRMANEYGVYLVVINIILNIIMAFISALMMNISSSFVNFSGKEGKGTFLTTVSVLFGFLTYGCTPCVISFFATVGITFSIAILPLAGLLYKLISLVLLVIGFMWLLYEVTHSKCSFKKVNEEVE